MKKTSIVILISVLLSGTASFGQEGAATAVEITEKEAVALQVTEADAHAYLELLRSDFRTRRMAFIVAYMQLTDEESENFWSIFREYEFDSSQLNDGKISLLRYYIDSYGNLTDETADDLVERFFEHEEKRIALLRKYYEKFSGAVANAKAARFIQLENQLNTLVNLQIASQIPLMQ